MKRLGAALTVVAVALACDQPVEPPGTGSIWISFAPAKQAEAPVVAPRSDDSTQLLRPRDEPDTAEGSLVRAASSDPTLSSYQTQALTGARINISGPTPKDTTVTLGASGGSVRLDELLVGTYAVKVWGLVGDTVDSYGEATNVSVTEGGATTVNLANPPSGTPWGSLRPALRPISPATTTAFTHIVHYGKVGLATGYTVEWSPQANFSSGVQSKSLADTITTITVSDTGRYYVRARATVSVTPTTRWSDTVSARVVMSTSGGSSSGGAEVVRAGLATVDTTIQGLNLFPNALEDWFALDACRDDTLLIETRAQRLNPASPLNTLLRLYQSDGSTLVASNDNIATDTTDSRIRSVAPSQGTYKIQVTQSGNTTGHYELSVGRHRGPENNGSSCAPVVSLSQSTVSVSATSITAGGTATFKLIAVDTHGGRMPSGGLVVAFSLGGGTSNGAIGVVTDSGNGAYTATFTGQTAGTASTVNATIGGAPVTSTLPAITVTAGPPVKLGFKTQPGGATAGTNIQPTVEVVVQDAFSNPISAVSGAVTIAIGTNPAGGTLFGTVTKALVSGVVQFTDLRIDKASPGYTLRATSSSFAAVTSDAFSITEGAAAKLAFSVQPTNTTGGTKVSPAMQVAIQDALGNTVTGAENPVTLSLASNPGTATLSGTLTKNAVNGIATFDSVLVDKAQTGYTLKAKATLLDSTISTGFNVAVGPASRLAYTVEPPSTATAGQVLSPAVKVTVQDAGGNTVTTAADSVTVGFGVDPTGGAALLAGTKKVKPTSGVATFSNLFIDKAASGYTLAASASTFTPDTTGAFTIEPNVPSKVGVLVQPSNTTAGGIIAPSVQVAIQDGFGNTVTGANNFVSVAIGNNPPGDASLSGTLTRQASGGLATFDDLSINKVGTGYTLSVTSSGLTSTTSNAFNVAASIIVSASQSTAIASPATDVVANGVETSTINVTVRDPDGNPIEGRTVLISATGTRNTITQPPGPTNASGVAAGTIASTKAELKTITVTVDTSVAGTDAVLTQHPTVAFIADATTISALLSTAVAVPADPDTVPGDDEQVSTITVTVVDTNSNPVSGQVVQLAKKATSNATLTQPGATNAGGVAVGTIKRLLAETVLAKDTITVTVDTSAAGTDVTLATQPLVRFVGALCTSVNATQSTVTASQDTIANGAAPIDVTVTVKNCSGTPMAGQTVQLAVSGTGNSITQPAATTDGSGVAAGTVRSTVAGAKTVTVTVNPGVNQRVLAQKPSVIFKPGPSADVAFLVQPGATAAGAAIAPAVQVAVVDAFGNTVDTATTAITVVLAANPGAGTLLGTTGPLAASGGVATFSNLSLQKAAPGYKLEASGTLGVTTVKDTSAAFTISPASAAVLAFQVQPANVAAGASITPAVEVKVVDAYANIVTSATTSITVAIGTNAADSANGVLSGTKIRNAVSGVASFNNLNIDRSGNGYTLTAAGGGLTGATSTTFNVTAGAKSKLAFKTGPTTTTAGASIAPAVEVVVQDAFGNKVDTATTSVTVSFNTDPTGSATLGGSLTQNASAGVATFNNLTITKAATGYALKATGGGLTQAVSGSFNINAAPASQLAFTVQPANAAAGSAINPAPQVTVQDPYGNTVAGFADSVTVAIANNPGSGVLSGTKKVAPVSGIATFLTLNIDKVGTGYTLSATAPGVSAATSSGFNITPATASKLAFVVQPSTVTAGVAIAPAVQVEVQDGLGNRVAGATNAVTIAFANNAGGATLLGTTTVAAVDGTASFSNLALDKASLGYTLEASSAGLTKDTSDAFTVNASTPVASTGSVSANPLSGVFADGAQLSTITVVVRDTFSNAVPGQSVTLASSGTGNTITQPSAPTGGTGTATGTIASTVAETKTVTATVAGSLVLTAMATVEFIPGTINGLLSTAVVNPDTLVANGVASATVTVTVRDNNSNPVPGQTVQIAVTGTGNTVTQPPALTNVSGVATGSIVSTKAETKTLTVTVNPGGSPVVLASHPEVWFVPGPPVQLGFVVQPTNVAAGAAVAPSIQVAIQDAQGNKVDTATTSVSLSIATGTTGAALYGGGPQTPSGGIATFVGIKVDSAGTGYALAASGGSLNAGTSSPFDVIPGAPYTVTVSPSADSIYTLGGNATYTAVAKDSVGNVIPDAAFTWFSSSEPVAIVDNFGTVTAIARGLSTISASTGGKTGMASLAVAVRVAGIGNSFGSAPGQIFSSGDLPGTFATLTPAAFNAFATAADLRVQFDVLLFVSTSDASVNADWASRLRGYLALGGGIVFEDPSNVGDLGPVATGTALTLTGGGMAVLSVPELTDGVSGNIGSSYQRYTAWSDSLAHFVVRGDTALGLYGRFGNGCVVMTGPAQATDGLRGGTATQSNQYALLLNEVRFAADCPLNATPGLAASVRVFPASVNFTNAGGTATPRATALDDVGTPIPNATITWSSLNDSVATVNPTTGQITAVRNGQVSIKAAGSGADYVVATVNVPAGVTLNAWGTEQAPGVLGSNYLMGIWGSGANNVFVTGFGGKVAHYNGSVWDTINTGTGDLWRVWGTASDDVFAVGAATILRYNGSTWNSMSDSVGAQTMLGVWGSSPTDVFAVGTGGTILHYDGSLWRHMTSPTTDVIYSVWGTSPRNVYAGSYNAILHYDGTGWSIVANPGAFYVFSLWGSGPSDIFGGTGGGPILHYDGSTWSSVANPAGARHMYGMWGTSATEVFASGSGGTILRYNGSTWSQMASPATDFVLALWGPSGGPIWGVGYVGTVWHGVRGAAAASVVVSPRGATVASVGASTNFTARAYDASGNVVTPASPFTWASLNTHVATIGSSSGTATGVSTGQAAVSATLGSLNAYGLFTVNDAAAGTVNLWDGQVTPNASPMYGIWGFASNDVFAVGDGGRVWRFNGSAWSETIPNGTFLWSVWGSAPNDVFAVGLNNTILHYNGTTWSPMTSPAPGTTTFWRVWGTAPNDVFAVGHDGVSAGVILHYDGTNWMSMTSGTANALYGVWGTASNNVFVSGAVGTILRYDGTSWTPLSSGVSSPLYHIWGSSTSNIFAVGGSGVVIQSTNNGGSWSVPMTTGTSNFLWSVWTRSGTEAYAVGGGNTLLRFNGTTWSAMTVNTSTSLRGVWGLSGADSVWTVGSAGAVLRSRGSIKVAGVGYNGGQAASGDILAANDLIGTYTQISDATFNAMTPAQLRANYDVLVFTWNTASTLNADWNTRLLPYMNLGGGIVWEDNVNVADLVTGGITAVNLVPSGAPFTLTSVPGLTNGVTNDLNHYHHYYTAPGTLSVFIKDALLNAVGLYGRFGSGCAVLTGPDPDYHAVKGAVDYTGNEYVFLVNKIRWAAGC